MIEHRPIEPVEFQRAVALLTQKIDALSGFKGEQASGYVDLQDALASLAPVSRDRASVLLDGIAMEAADENPAMAMAARYVRALAQEVWNAAQLTRSTARH